MVRFAHRLLPAADVRATTREGVGRVYHTPDGDFPSVTTVLGYALGNAGIEEWRRRVGAEEADAIRDRAARRGTAVHNIAERYVRNDPDWREGEMPLNLFTFEPLRRVLDRSMGDVLGVEYPLWSRRLATAGRTDLICVWDGELAIADYKTARKLHAEDSDVMRKHLLQATTYAIMASESTGLNITRLVILSCPDDHPAARVVVRDRSEFEIQVETIFAGRNRDSLAIPSLTTSQESLRAGTTSEDANETTNPGRISGT